MEYSLDYLLKNDGFVCPCCGRKHYGFLDSAYIGPSAVLKLPEAIKRYDAKKAYVLCDVNTYRAAGEKVCEILKENGIEYNLHVIDRDRPAPDDRTVGEAVMFAENSGDIVVAVGGGVINDTGKIIAAMKNVPDIIVATAPSMDGFASATSSMERCGFKVSVNSKCPNVVIGDTDILRKAPMRMTLSGIGDMLAKYVSIAEWKIARLLLNEYYCDVIADIVNVSLEKVVKNSKAALAGDETAICDIMEGLVLSGMCMNYAGISRPASGMEHYVSHIIDMRALEFGTPSDFHGIQCGIATLETIKVYEKIASRIPDYEYARGEVDRFDPDGWNAFLRERLGRGADAMIAKERTEGKYDKERHAERLGNIISSFGEIMKIAASLPESGKLEKFMTDIGHPTEFTEIGLKKNEIEDSFVMAKDIRDKYVLGRLLWDLGWLKSDILE